jgi:hypothetical protein
VTGDLSTVQHQIDRYFTLLYGENYVYRAPETFTNALERWMLLVASGDLNTAGIQMLEIEEMIQRGRG